MIWGRFDCERSRLNIYDQPHFEPGSGISDIETVTQEIQKILTMMDGQPHALIKAKDAFLHTGLPSLADDSGLCVNALDGRPGVFSARYLGNMPQHEKNMSLIAELDGKTDRSAKFVCELVLYSGAGEVAHAVGEVKGEILFEERGTGGFGYDSIFFCTELKKSFGEATEDEKNAVSHRGRACENMAALLKNP